MTDKRFTTVPEGWPPATGQQMNRGVEIAREVLHDPGVVDDLARYYDRDGNYAGATFLDSS